MSIETISNNMKFSNIIFPVMACIPTACVAFAPVVSNVQISNEKATSVLNPAKLLNSRLYMAGDVS